MTSEFPPAFARQYDSHLKHLKLKGLQPKTIDAYARAIRRLGGYFDYRIDALSEAQLTEYFSDLIGTHSWSAVKLDLYSLGLRLGEGLALKVGDIDAARMRVQVRDARSANRPNSPLSGWKSKSYLQGSGLVQQPVQIVARFAITI